MQQLYDDLWQTQQEIPFAQVKTHAYFLQCTQGNVLFYNTSQQDDISQIAQLGGIKYQYLSHRDEAGASLQSIKVQFGSKLCSHSKEEPFIRQLCTVDIIFSKRITHFAGIEVIPTPGHTAGSTSFLYHSALSGLAYLFTGDTFFQTNGDWQTIFFAQSGGSAEALIKSLSVYKALSPDVVIWSASGGGTAFARLSQNQWQEALDNNIKSLKKQI